jgi:SAM-dependent methyltransferase
MPDQHFEHPRRASVYDALDPDRSDLVVYAALVAELGARRAVDVGCGTGTFALLLAQAGIEVVGVDPAAGSLAVARGKPGAGDVGWVHGDASDLPALGADVATMTGNVARPSLHPRTGNGRCGRYGGRCAPVAAWSWRPGIRRAAAGGSGPPQHRGAWPRCAGSAGWRAGRNSPLSGSRW